MYRISGVVVQAQHPTLAASSALLALALEPVAREDGPRDAVATRARQHGNEQFWRECTYATHDGPHLRLLT